MPISYSEEFHLVQKSILKMDAKDILAFLKAQEERRQAEREDDRKVLNELGEKIGTSIKAELKEMMKPKDGKG